MKKNNRTGSHLFFIEFLIVLFFFLIVSTVCLRMFARAHGITRRADALSHAQAAAASVAAAVEQVITDGPEETGAGTAQAVTEEENIPEDGAGAKTGSQNAGTEETGTEDGGTALLRQAAEYLPDAFLTHLPDSPESQEGLAAAYDETFQPCAIEDAYYLLTAVLTADGQVSGLQTAPEEKQKDGQNDQEDRREGALETLHVSVHDYHQNLVYELSASFHRPATRKEALQ